MSDQINTQIAVEIEETPQEVISRELEKFFENCELSDILCDGRCATCLQREWCLLTPVSRYVK